MREYADRRAKTKQSFLAPVSLSYMNIDSTQLRTFVTVLREGSFEGAARVLNVTAPAISQRIKQLEERLGQVLIRRTQPCQATDAGTMLARYAEQIALLEAETLRALSDTTSTSRSHIRVPVAVNADSLDSWFMAVFEEWPEAASLYLDLRTDDQDHSADMLRDGTVIAAVTAERQAVQGCHVILLGNMRYLPVASPEYVRRYFPGGVQFDALARAPMLQYNAKDTLQARFLANYESKETTGSRTATSTATSAPVSTAVSTAVSTLSPPTHFVPSTTGFLEGTRRGMAWGMIPEVMAATHMASGELVPLAPDAFLDVPLYWQYWSISSAVLDMLSTAVQAVAKRLLRQ